MDKLNPNFGEPKGTDRYLSKDMLSVFNRLQHVDEHELLITAKVVYQTNNPDVKSKRIARVLALQAIHDEAVTRLKAEPTFLTPLLQDVSAVCESRKFDEDLPYCECHATYQDCGYQDCCR